MPFVKGGPGGPGRKKSENTLKKESLARSSTVAKGEAKAVIEAARLSGGKAKVKQPKEIAPKELMLAAMREAWAAYKEGGIEVQALRARGLEIVDEANHLTPTEGEAASTFRERKAEALEAGKQLLDQAQKVMDRVGSSLDRALECAKAAAPFEHAKLQTSTIQGEMELTVNIKQYGPAPAKAKK